MPIQLYHSLALLHFLQLKTESSWFQWICLCSIISMTRTNSAPCSVGHFPENFWADAFRSKSRCLFTVFSGFVVLLCIGPLQEVSKMNYHTATVLGLLVACRGERSDLVTHGQSNCTKVFPNNDCVMCLWPLLLEGSIVFNTKVFQLRHKSGCSVSRQVCWLTGPSKKCGPKSFSIHPSPYHDILMTIMWILPGPEHNVTCRMAHPSLKTAFPPFGIVLNVWIILARAFRLQFKSVSLSSWINGRRYRSNLHWTFMCFCIAERGIPGFAIRLGTDICGDWQQIPRPVLTAAIWLMAFQVLDYFYVACCKE